MSKLVYPHRTHSLHHPGHTEPSQLCSPRNFGAKYFFKCGYYFPPNSLPRRLLKSGWITYILALWGKKNAYKIFDKNAPRAWTKCENTECNIWRPGCHLAGIATLTWRPVLYLSTGCGVLLALRLLEHEARKLRFFSFSRVPIHSPKSLYHCNPSGGFGWFEQAFRVRNNKIVHPNTYPARG